MPTTKVVRVRLYDDESHRTISFSTQQVDGELKGPLITQALVPGSLNDGTYVRTDMTGTPQEIQNIANLCWTEATHTAYEQYLRAQ